MESGSESESPTVQDDFDELVHLVLPIAENLLRTQRDFAPYAATLPIDGTAALVDTLVEGKEPRSEEMLELLYEHARSDSASIRAAVFVADVLAQGRYAVRLEMEHRSGVALVALVPYRRGMLLRKMVTFATMRVSMGLARVWPSESDNDEFPEDTNPSTTPAADPESDPTPGP